MARGPDRYGRMPGDPDYGADFDAARPPKGMKPYAFDLRDAELNQDALRYIPEQFWTGEGNTHPAIPDVRKYSAGEHNPRAVGAPGKLSWGKSDAWYDEDRNLTLWNNLDVFFADLMAYLLGKGLQSLKPKKSRKKK